MAGLALTDGQRQRLANCCLILDLDGYTKGTQGGFIPRELGWYSLTDGSNGSHHYYPWCDYDDLSPRDKTTARYVYRHIHGLPFYPQTEGYHLLGDFHDDVQALYRRHRTERQTWVAYKGGHLERDFLKRWNIPHYNLEEAGCPKFEKLSRLRRIASCGQHVSTLHHHCPRVECAHFGQWVRARLGLSYDTDYIHVERSHRLV